MSFKGNFFLFIFCELRSVHPLHPLPSWSYKEMTENLESPVLRVRSCVGDWTQSTATTVGAQGVPHVSRRSPSVSVPGLNSRSDSNRKTRQFADGKTRVPSRPVDPTPAETRGSSSPQFRCLKRGKGVLPHGLQEQVRFIGGKELGDVKFVGYTPVSFQDGLPP